MTFKKKRIVASCQRIFQCLPKLMTMQEKHNWVHTMAYNVLRKCYDVCTMFYNVLQCSYDHFQTLGEFEAYLIKRVSICGQFRDRVMPSLKQKLLMGQWLPKGGIFQASFHCLGSSKNHFFSNALVWLGQVWNRKGRSVRGWRMHEYCLRGWSCEGWWCGGWLG